MRRGRSGPRHWSAPPRDVDAFDAKADAQAVLAALGFPADNMQIVAEAPGWYHPGRSGSFKLGPKLTIASFGELHPSVLQELDARGPLVGFELFLDALPLPKAKAGKTRAAFVLPGIAILEAVLRGWPVGRIRVADRGVREGILAQLMGEAARAACAGRASAAS